MKSQHYNNKTVKKIFFNGKLKVATKLFWCFLSEEETTEADNNNGGNNLPGKLQYYSKFWTVAIKKMSRSAQ